MAKNRTILIVALAITLALLTPFLPSNDTLAQDDGSTGAPIGFNGIVESVDMDAQIIVVAGLEVNISNIGEIDFEIEVGTSIEVIGVLQGGIVIAAVITISDMPEMTP
ncbi:MAG: hypothetical protein RLP44_15980, partial [Aggregatilineales bacterium]